MKIEDLKELIIDTIPTNDTGDIKDLIKATISENYNKSNALNWLSEMPQLASLKYIKDSGFDDIHNIYDIIKANLHIELEAYINNQLNENENRFKI